MSEYSFVCKQCERKKVVRDQRLKKLPDGEPYTPLFFCSIRCHEESGEPTVLNLCAFGGCKNTIFFKKGLGSNYIGNFLKIFCSKSCSTSSRERKERLIKSKPPSISSQSECPHINNFLYGRRVSNV